ncbi:MAG: WYL domain-containing protein [Oscillospiraceae bacterium]
MKLFSEINCTYYNITEKILKQKAVTKEDIRRIISKNGFSETVLFLEPELIGKNNIGLLTEQDGIYTSILKNEPHIPLTYVQKKWLCAVLNDKKSSLFLDKEQKAELYELLGAEPLFDRKSIHFFDRFTDGDDFENEDYIRHFRNILRSMHENRLIRISFQTRKNNRVTHYYLPERIEYSSKNDKFRVHVIRYNKSKPIERGIINIAQINSVELTDIIAENGLYEASPKKEVILKVSNERNAINRFMMEFAEFERVSEYDDESKECTVTMKYDAMDETEILIRILSFGPVVEVLQPDDLRAQIAHRIGLQRQLCLSMEHA